MLETLLLFTRHIHCYKIQLVTLTKIYYTSILKGLFPLRLSVALRLNAFKRAAARVKNGWRHFL